MLYLIRCFIIFFFGFPLVVQADSNERYLDSLTQVVASDTSSVINKVDALNELAWQYRNSNPRLSLQFAESAKAKSEDIQYKEGLASSYNRIGIYYKNTGDYTKAIEAYEQCYILRDQLDNDLGIAFYEHLQCF